MSQQGVCNRVFIIGLDGAIGRCVRDARTPNIDALISAGVKTYAAQTVFPSASFDAWGAMFHGVGPEKHNLGKPRPCPEDVSWPSFMKVLHRERPGSRLASFSCWEPINSRIIEQSCGCHCVSMPDPELVEKATEYIRSHPPDMFFMQLDGIDAAGHSHGYGTKLYLEQITTADALVGLVISAIKDAGVFDESLIVILSDHGGEAKSHGSDHPDCMTVFWACRGPGIVQGGDVGDMNIMDTAAVVAGALGLTCATGWDAKIPEGVFSR
jgi:predicted AlkP superfamily pyrophosphatase or phosphodiesterase